MTLKRPWPFLRATASVSDVIGQASASMKSVGRASLMKTIIHTRNVQGCAMHILAILVLS